MLDVIARTLLQATGVLLVGFLVAMIGAAGCTLVVISVPFAILLSICQYMKKDIK